MRLWLLLLLLLLLSMLLTTGCSGQEELPATSAVFPERSSVAQKQSEIILSSSFYSPFPDDKIRFDFPFHLKADRFYETGPPPVARRGLVLEFLEATDRKSVGSGQSVSVRVA